jgi:hypothetical protein
MFDPNVPDAVAQASIEEDIAWLYQPRVVLWDNDEPLFIPEIAFVTSDALAFDLAWLKWPERDHRMALGLDR